MTDEKIDSPQSIEPLGYQHFLRDVNIEFNRGGNHVSLDDNKYCFKMKFLPYMVRRDEIRGSLKELYSYKDAANQENVKDVVQPNHNDTDDCDQDISSRSNDPCSTEDIELLKHLDVTQTTCAFLGNSDYVPSDNFRRRRVVLELISAKLSQPQITQTPTPSSKRFVNYTILIKSAPGLDSRPAVIERRFSDFLLLYQGLKASRAHAEIIDKYVNFPGKVYMGNFSLVKIAERSVEFTRLLNLCMSRQDLLWSKPFISFLIDKELAEVHRLALVGGDPEDAQSLLDTVYHIKQKLYANGMPSSSTSSSSPSSSLDFTRNDNEQSGEDNK